MMDGWIDEVRVSRCTNESMFPDTDQFQTLLIATM